MRRFAVLVVRFERRDLSLIADNSPIPDERLATVRGEQFFQRRDGRRLQLPQISDPINEGLRLLQERCAPRHDQMLLFQQAEAEAVPLVRARAEVGTGRGEFWVYGKDRRLFFPPGQALARLDWVRIAGALTVLFGAAALALYWFVR